MIICTVQKIVTSTFYDDLSLRYQTSVTALFLAAIMIEGFQEKKKNGKSVRLCMERGGGGGGYVK